MSPTSKSQVVVSIMLKSRAHGAVCSHVRHRTSQCAKGSSRCFLASQHHRTTGVRSTETACRVTTSFGGSQLLAGHVQHRASSQAALLPGRSALHHSSRQTTARKRHVATRAAGIIPLGYDFLTFLTTTVLVVPTCKYFKVSPVLGYLFAGVVLQQAG